MNLVRLTILLLFFSHFLSAQQTVGLFINDSLALNGYTLIAPSSETKTYLIDNCGLVVHTWEASNYFPGASVYLLENGNLLRTGRLAGIFGGGGLGGRIEMFNWDDDLIWSYNYASDKYHHHHDIAYLPNGNILLLAWELFTNDEAIAAGRNPDMTDGNVWSEKVVELKPLGGNSAEVVWEWRLWDHLIQDIDSTKANFGVVAEHPELLNINFGNTASTDWIHFNSIDYNSNLDQVLLSSRELSEIYIIDHSTTSAEAASHSGGNGNRGGDFLFRWGNPLAYNRGLVSEQKFFGQHNANWIPKDFPDEGKIMVFNNGLGRFSGDYSSIDVIDSPFENNEYNILSDEPFEPNNLFWTYEANPPNMLFSGKLSSAQRLSNGNTFICEGRSGNFYEVTYDGAIIWHYRLPIGNNGPVTQGSLQNTGNIFKGIKYGTNFPAFINKDLTPTIPIELNPLPSDCQIYTNTRSLKLFSESNILTILNNPIEDFLYLKNENLTKVQIQIFDLMGRVLVTLNSHDELIEINTNSWESGIYMVRIIDEKKHQFSLKKIIKI